MKKLILIASMLLPLIGWGQEETKKALRLDCQFEQRKPKIIYPGERIIYKITKDALRHEGKIREVTDSSLIFTDSIEVKFKELRVIRKPSDFKKLLAKGFTASTGLILSGIALTIIGSSNALGGLTTLGIVFMSIGTPITAAIGYPFFAIKTRFDMKKEYKASAFLANELLQKKGKTTEQ